MYRWGCGANQVCSNVDPRLALAYLTPRSNSLPSAFKWDFLKTIEAMPLFSLNKFQRSMLPFDLSAKVAHIGVPSILF